MRGDEITDPRPAIASRGLRLVGFFLTKRRFAWKLQSASDNADILSGNSSVDAIKLSIEKLLGAVDLLNKAIYDDALRGQNPSQTGLAAAKVREEGRRFAKDVFGDSFGEVGNALAGASHARLAFAMAPDFAEWPWEFCVFSDPGGENPREFVIGETCLVSRRPFEAMPNLPPEVHREIGQAYSGPISAGYAEDHALGSSCVVYGTVSGKHEEADALREILGEDGSVDYLDPLPGHWGIGSKESVKRWLDGSHDVFHFNCHSAIVEHPSGKAPGAPAFAKSTRTHKMRVRNSAMVGGQEMGELAEQGSLTENALIFLNACGTAFGQRGVASLLPQAFFKMEAAVIACTIGPVDDSVAAKFAREFYRSLARPRRTVAEAVLVARRAVAKEGGHPLANLYAVLGREDVTLRTPEVAAR